MTSTQQAAVRAVVVEGFFTRLGFGMVTFALPLYGLSIGMNVAEVGLLAGARALVEPVVKPLAGRFVDRYGVRRGYLGAVSIRLLGSLLLFVAATPAALIGVRFLQGAASAARDPASISLIARQSKIKLGRTFSATIGARDLGNVLSGVLAGGILAVTGGSFKVLWAVVIALAVIPVAAVYRSVDRHEPASGAEPPPNAEREPEPEPEPDSAPVATRHRIRLIGALGLFAGLTAHMTHGLFQIYATEVGGLSPGQVGLIYSLAVVTLLATGPLFGWASDRFGIGPLIPVRGVANALSSVLYLVAPSFAGILAARFVDDTGKAAFRPAWGTLMASVVRSPGERRGRAVSNVDALLSVGEALGPLLAGLLWSWKGVAAMFVVRGVLGVATEVFIGRRLRNVPVTDQAMAAGVAGIGVAGSGAIAEVADPDRLSSGPTPGRYVRNLSWRSPAPPWQVVGGLIVRRLLVVAAIVGASVLGLAMASSPTSAPLEPPVIQLQREAPATAVPPVPTTVPPPSATVPPTPAPTVPTPLPGPAPTPPAPHGARPSAPTPQPPPVDDDDEADTGGDLDDADTDADAE